MPATTVKSVKIKLAFQDASTRIYTFNDVDENLVPAEVKEKVRAINANMPASFAVTFVSAGGAQCVMISEVQIIDKSEEVIYSAS